MDLERMLYSYGEGARAVPSEQKVAETVKKSIEAFYSAERGLRLTHWEFLLAQLRLIRKRWWALQAALLALLWARLPFILAEASMRRIFAASASLFVILIIPELWKNRSCKSMEIEAASYYSLRQVYAARMLLFGIVDIAMVTVFCIFASAGAGISLFRLLAEFLIPMAATAAICFWAFCSRRPCGEPAAIMLCIAWSGAWMAVILNERVYSAITLPLWMAFAAIAAFFLAFMICRALRGCDLYWEDCENEIGIG